MPPTINIYVFEITLKLYLQVYGLGFV